MNLLDLYKITSFQIYVYSSVGFTFLQGTKNSRCCRHRRRINKKLTRGVLDLFVQHSWRLGYSRATGSQPGQFAILAVPSHVGWFAAARERRRQRRRLGATRFNKSINTRTHTLKAIIDDEVITNNKNDAARQYSLRELARAKHMENATS